MSRVQEHYDSLLGPIYTWMLGDFVQAVDAAISELESLGLDETGASDEAIDLGAGPGVYSIALARLGYTVTAVDNCQPLVTELSERSKGLQVSTLCKDIGAYIAARDAEASLILCMGDTLTHLASMEEVDQLLTAIPLALRKGGRFVATFRDYSTELVGCERFIPVRQDHDRIMTCFLEYGEQSVEVHDIIHDRVESQWVTRVSSYPKVRLSPDWARASLERVGLEARVESAPRGMVRLTARAE